jgi:hypothetical protein
MLVTDGGHAKSYRLFDAYCISTKTMVMRVDQARQYCEAGLGDDWKVRRRFSADAEFCAAAISNNNTPSVDESVISEYRNITQDKGVIHVSGKHIAYSLEDAAVMNLPRRQYKCNVNREKYLKSNDIEVVSARWPMASF